MRKLALAVILVLAAAALLAVALRALLVHEDLVGSAYEVAVPLAIASLALALVVSAHQSLIAGRPRLSLAARPDHVASLEEYRLPWQVLAVYAACVVYGLSGIGTIGIWAIGEISGLYLTPAIAPLRALIAAVGWYLAGSWIGARADRRPALAAGAAVLLFVLAGAIAAMLQPSASALVVGLAVLAGLPLYLAAALLGVWRGRRRQLASYVQFLLRFVAPDARGAVVRSAYQGVRQLVTQQPTAGPSYAAAPATEGAAPGDQGV